VTLIVRFLEAGANLAGDPDRLPRAQPADLADELPEVLAVNVLHGNVSGALTLATALLRGIRWSLREGSNLRPADYESAALPLQITDNK